MPSFAWRTSINWIIPGFRNGYRTLARPRAVFIDFAFAGDLDHMPSSGQKQFNRFLSPTFPSLPSQTFARYGIFSAYGF